MILQAIRPAQEKFRKAIRVTAPDFCPFERKFKGTRQLGRATFLHSEEGEEWNESESNAKSCFDPVSRFDNAKGRSDLYR